MPFLRTKKIDAEIFCGDEQKNRAEQRERGGCAELKKLKRKGVKQGFYMPTKGRLVGYLVG